MPLADLYAYLLERKLMTPVFYRPRDGLLAPSFYLSKKCEHHFGAERHTLEECYHLKDRIQDLIDNKLIQFNNTATSNIITNPLPPPHQEGNVNAIITVEERVLDFSSPSFQWKAMLQALVQESHLVLKSMGTPGFDWGICLFYDSEESHNLFDCKVLWAQVQSLAKRGIIWIEREIVLRGYCMVASLYPLAIKSGASCNAISVGSKKE